MDGRETALALQVADLRDFRGNEDAWLDVAIESAHELGFDGPSDEGCDEYVDEFVTAADAATIEKLALEFRGVS